MLYISTSLYIYVLFFYLCVVYTINLYKFIKMSVLVVVLFFFFCHVADLVYSHCDRLQGVRVVMIPYMRMMHKWLKRNKILNAICSNVLLVQKYKFTVILSRAYKPQRQNLHVQLLAHKTMLTDSFYFYSRLFLVTSEINQVSGNKMIHTTCGTDI